MAAGTRIRVRRDTAATWTSVNPILLDGEVGYEKDTKKMKIGDGTTAWIDLTYVNNASGGTSTIIVGGIFDPFLLSGM